jgi:YVTN family beta-propeller protein
VFLLLLTPPVVLGQSVLQFPRVIATGEIYTGLAVGNPTGTEVTVTFLAFQPDGTALAGGARNPATVTIPPAGQYAGLFPEIFGVPTFNGWVQASSVTSGLTGFLVSGNTRLTDLNGAGSVAPGVDMILPLAVEDTAARTEVTIVNVNAESAAVSLTLYADDGSVLVTRNISLPARGLVRQTLGVVLGIAGLSAASHLRVRADRPVVAHEVVADFLLPGTNIRRETAAVTGSAPSAERTYVVPQFATGGEWLSVIGLVNASGVAQEVTISAYQEDGSLWQVDSNPKRVTLPGNGALRAMAGDLFGFSPDALSTGWIQVTSAQGFVLGYIGYGNSLTPSFALVQATPLEDASRYAVFSHVAEGAGFYTGLTVLNAGTEAADVEFYALRSDGSTVGRAALTLGPNQKMARLFRELLPASLDQVGGWGFLRSSKPVVGTVLFGSSSFALANVPQQLPAGDFTPPAQATAAITGTVRSANSGISGVQITLSGPVTAVRTSDDSGRYVFPQLPAGQYKVVAGRAGAVVVPSERNVSLNRDNVDAVDFDAGGIAPADAPVLSVITPVSVFSGSGSLTVRIIGTNFTPSSVVRFNDLAAPTSYVSSTELNAAVSASFLSQPATLQVGVETPPPGGGRSAVLNFTVSPTPSDPLIAGRAPVGSFPAGVAIDTTRRRALVTNQSGDSVTVLDLTTFQALAEVRVGRSPAEGIDLHPGKDIALVANPGSNDVSVIDLRTNTVTRTIKAGRFPIGVAVNTETNRAYVVNGEDDNLSVINLDTFDVLGQIGVGPRPSDVAVNARTNQAVVTNRGGNSVTVIDLNNGSIVGTVPVREFPRGVAIHPETNRAVVVNANGNSVSILNLANRIVEATVDVGAGPTGAALHLATNSVIVTNSGVTRSNPGFGGISSVSVINLDRRDVVATIPAGSAAFGVDVDEERQMAVVAGFGSNDVTVVRIPNPVPRIAAIEPKIFQAGGSSFTVTIRGTGFLPVSVLTLNRQPLPTVFVSSTELRGTVSAAMVDQFLQVRSAGISSGVKPVEFNIGVENPGPGGGGNPPSDTPGGTTIQPLNAAPVLLSLSPTDIQFNTSDLNLTLSGNNFNATSIVNFGGLQLSPSSSSPTAMTVVIGRAQLAAGTVQVTVTNPAPGGGTSSAMPFRVNAEVNPAPAVTSVIPSSIPAGSGRVVVNVTGTGFIGSTTGSLAGIAGAAAGNTISFVLPPDQTETSGTLNGMISTPTPGGGTATFSVNVINPAPAIAGFTPATADVGEPSVSIQVSGTNFRSNSRITLAATPIPTTFVSPAQLTGTIPASLLARPAELPVGVTNPAPGGGSADGDRFRIIERTPLITSVTPDRLRPGQAFRIFGLYFRSNSTVLLRGAGISSSFVSSTELTATIPNPTAFGSADLMVSNPALDAGAPLVSSPFNILIVNPAPTLMTMSPSAGVSGTIVAITLIGADFEPGAQIVFGGTPIATTFFNAATLGGSATLGTAGNVLVTATNPGGFISNSLVFTVTAAPPPPPNPAPAVESVSPNLVAFGASDQTITITGANFIPATTVTFAGTSVTISNRTATSLVIVVPAALLTPGGNKTIAVTNPAPGGGTAQATFLANAFLLTPIDVEKRPNGTQQFAAVVSGTLIWSVNGIDGGNATYGTISNSGFYTAPATAPAPAAFRVCARLSTDPAVIACGTVTIRAVP